MNTTHTRSSFGAHFCPVCGSELISKGNGYYLCPKCNELSQSDLSKIRQFLIEYPDATVEKIALQFSFDVDYVQQFLDSGELSSEALKKADLHCKRCRKRIPFGHYCNDCKHLVALELNKAFH
ncbi:MAG: hypothetical protein ACI4HI_04960 [Lachnospiraceae bacterium]